MIGNKILLASICTLFLSACGGSSDDTIVYAVSVPSQPEYFDTAVFNDTLPLNAKATGKDGPDTRANGIAGFSHRFGTQYELEISRTETEINGTYAPVYRLISVISEKRDEVGTVYTFPNVHLYSRPIYIDASGKYRFSPYEFLCAENIDCDALVNIADSGGIVSIEFTLTDSETVPITLTSWR